MMSTLRHRPSLSMRPSKKTDSRPGDAWVFRCRSGCEPLLADELRERLGIRTVHPEQGSVRVQTDAPPPRCIFSGLVFRDRGQVRTDRLNPLSPETVASIINPDVPRSLLVVAASPELRKRAAGFERALLREAGKSFGWAPADPLGGSPTLALFLTTQGLRFGEALSGEDLERFREGLGPIRARMDSRAPSRSYLKIEESFMRMGEYPHPGERVIDLGAAPGGWTFAFWKRGCEVLAVDRGPMKLPHPEHGFGLVRHIRANGISYEPDPGTGPVDWLVSDMLVAPGVALGLLKRWVKNRRARRVICNIKLPQNLPFSALRPVEEWMATQSWFEARIVHLYHDRREVTVLGRLGESGSG